MKNDLFIKYAKIFNFKKGNIGWNWLEDLLVEAERRTLEGLRSEILATIKIDKLSTMTMGDVGHNLAVEKILKLINSKLKK